jgi:aspergillopepsin I
MVFMDNSTRMTDVQNRWVFSSEMPSSQSAGHHIYDPSMSSTAAEMDGYTWSITYLDESYASGNVYQDTVEVGGTIVTAQAVELAEEVSPKFVTGPFDGILGAAFAVDTSMSGLMFA